LREFEAFDAVLRCGSVTRAAESLGISQPAVSKLLTSLELGLGLRLFERSRRRLAPTIEALRLHEEVARFFVGARRIEELVQEIQISGHGELSIAALPILGLSFLPRLVSQLRCEHPGLKISFTLESSREVRESLLNRTADVGFVLPLSDQSPLRHGWTIRVPAMAVLPPEHRLARRQTLSPADFQGESFISLGRTYRMRHLVDALFDAANVTRILDIETQNAFAACELVVHGAGVTVVDSITARDFAARAVVCQLEPTIPFQFNVLLPPSAAPPMLVTILIERLAKALEGVGEVEATKGA
jgi:DNA-binding transcriptional LysR family regulator